MDYPLFLSNTKREKKRKNKRKNKKIPKILSSQEILEEQNIPSIVIQWAMLSKRRLLSLSFVLFNFYFLPFFLLLSMQKSTVFPLFSVVCRFLLFQNLTFELPRKKRSIIFLCFISNLCYCRDSFNQSALGCESLVPEVAPPSMDLL